LTPAERRQDRPARAGSPERNALSFELLSGLRHALTEHKKNLARVVVIRSNRGTKVWSAGFFVDELAQDGSDPLAYDHPLLEVIRQIQDFPAPVIVMAEGSIWGGACNIAFVADIVIGTKETSMAITPAKLGVPYDTSGILQFLETLGGHAVGVINHLVPVEGLQAFTGKRKPAFRGV
jgi:methylmalonyl-CoA decarboxylase